MEVSKLQIDIKCVNVIQAKLDLSQCWSTACWSGHAPWASYILGLAEFMCVVFQLCEDLQLLYTLFLLVAFILLPRPLTFAGNLASMWVGKYFHQFLLV